jgi:hypothetical protein
MNVKILLLAIVGIFVFYGIALNFESIGTISGSFFLIILAILIIIPLRKFMLSSKQKNGPQHDDNSNIIRHTKPAPFGVLGSILPKFYTRERDPNHQISLKTLLEHKGTPFFLAACGFFLIIRAFLGDDPDNPRAALEGVQLIVPIFTAIIFFVMAEIARRNSSTNSKLREDDVEDLNYLYGYFITGVAVYLLALFTGLI